MVRVCCGSAGSRPVRVGRSAVLPRRGAGGVAGRGGAAAAGGRHDGQSPGGGAGVIPGRAAVRAAPGRVDAHAGGGAHPARRRAGRGRRGGHRSARPGRRRAPRADPADHDGVPRHAPHRPQPARVPEAAPARAPGSAVHRRAPRSAPGGGRSGAAAVAARGARAHRAAPVPHPPAALRGAELAACPGPVRRGHHPSRRDGRPHPAVRAGAAVVRRPGDGQRRAAHHQPVHAVPGHPGRGGGWACCPTSSPAPTSASCP